MKSLCKSATVFPQKIFLRREVPKNDEIIAAAPETLEAQNTENFLKLASKIDTTIARLLKTDGNGIDNELGKGMDFYNPNTKADISGFEFPDGERTDIGLKVIERGNTTMISLTKDPDGLNNSTITQLVLDKVSNKISLKKGGDEVAASAEMISQLMIAIEGRANQLNEKIDRYKISQQAAEEAKKFKSEFQKSKDEEFETGKMLKDL